MVYVTAGINIQEGKVDEFLKIAKELVEKTNKLDEGCIQYELCQDVNAPNQFYMVERWESEQLLQTHMQAEHFVNLVPKVKELTTTADQLMIMKKVF